MADCRLVELDMALMKVGMYLGGGRVEVQSVPVPPCPRGGLLVRTEACGLCSGELMDWYMDRKAPHVLGHEVAGVVIESDDSRFPVGCRVAPHHHAACMRCDRCARRAYVHCEQWKKTRLDPGGMAEYIAVSAANLDDCHRTDDLAPETAALVEPIGCVVKSLWRAQYQPGEPAAVVGLGFMGLAHMMLMPAAVGYDTNPERVAYAKRLGFDARHPDFKETADIVIVCPGSPQALSFALSIAEPDARIGLFAPMPPSSPVSLDLESLYFRDLRLTCSYSCGPDDTSQAVDLLRAGKVRADRLVTQMVSLDEIPTVYTAMKSGQVIKPMVTFKKG